MTEFSPTLYAEFSIILGEIPARGAYQPTPPPPKPTTKKLWPLSTCSFFELGLC